MIRSIAAIDSKLGIANQNGIPWQGRIPSDVGYFRDKTHGSVVLMGYNTYQEFRQPLSNRRNVVWCRPDTQLRIGFEQTSDIETFIKMSQDDIWIIGGARLFANTLQLCDELYITQLYENFECTKFFPEFQNDFKLTSESPTVTENGIKYRFQVWRK